MKRAQVYSALPLISASQISTFRECQRKWAWRYIAKIESPPHPSAALGTEVHDTQLGPYLTEGRPFDYTRDSGYIAASLLEFLPQPKTPGMVVEKHFILPSPASGGKFAYQGYKDLWLPARCTEHEDCRAHPELGLACAAASKSPPTVIDFKTTSDLKWAKNEKALSVDVQAMLYATNALFETKSEEVDLAWLYAQTRGARKSKRTHLRVHADQAIEQFRAIEETALEMFDVKQTVTDPLSLPPSPAQCEAYGGCPYRDKCNLSPVDHLAALSARDFSLLELNGGMDMSGTVSAGTSSLLANLKARKAGAQAQAPAPSAAESELRKDAEQALADLLEPGRVALGINPPEKDLPPPEVAKRGPGRPRKQPKAEEAKPSEQASVEEPSKQLELPLEAASVPAPVVPSLDYGKLADCIIDRFFARLARSA